MIRVLILLLLIAGVQAEVSIIMKGMWSVECDSVHISNHNRFDKAIESALNQGKNFLVVPPDRFEVNFTAQVVDNEEPKKILLSWELPTEREDGSKIEKIDRFNLYVYFNYVFQNVIQVTGDATSYELSEVETGDYMFQISTVEAGLEGYKSPAITVEVVE